MICKTYNINMMKPSKIYFFYDRTKKNMLDFIRDFYETMNTWDGYKSWWYLKPHHEKCLYWHNLRRSRFKATWNYNFYILFVTLYTYRCSSGIIKLPVYNIWFSSSKKTWCYAMLCYAMLCYVLCAMCYAMLCYAMLFYAMLFYAMLFYSMLFYAMLCSTLRYAGIYTFVPRPKLKSLEVRFLWDPDLKDFACK